MQHIKSRLDTAKENISKLKDVAMKSNQNEREKKTEQSISKQCNLKQPNTCVIVNIKYI